ncbi:MAG TPA: GlsB/YeaQ/YmgE family stress response membrane protein [Bryobacteraceae bacterium]|nr:GlsB/YeaQ/YmgE family stress response membrane protein [Bryobacteraceae bacterium]
MWLFWMIIIGLIAGWAAGKVMRGSGYGVFMDIVLGVCGAFVGGWLLRLLGVYSGGGLVPSILVAILGAVILVAFVRVLRRA